MSDATAAATAPTADELARLKHIIQFSPCEVAASACSTHHVRESSAVYAPMLRDVSH